MIILSIVAMARQQLRRTTGTLWLAFWTAGASAIVWPDITRIVASTLGIGRGTDLVMYCGFLATAVAFFFFYLRFRRLNADLAKLVRNLAIREARTPNKNTALEKSQAFPSDEPNNTL
jgi:hypothetical protein